MIFARVSILVCRKELFTAMMEFARHFTSRVVPFGLSPVRRNLVMFVLHEGNASPSVRTTKEHLRAFSDRPWTFSDGAIARTRVEHLILAYSFPYQPVKTNAYV